MKLIDDGTGFTFLHDNGKVFSTRHMNIMLIYCLKNANIEESELAEAFVSMDKHDHNVAHFGSKGTFLFSERKNVNGQN